MNSFKKINRRAGNTLGTVKYNLRKFLPVFIALPIIFLINFLLTIKKIDCTFNQNFCPGEVHLVTDKLIGTNALFVNQKELQTFVKTVYPIDKFSVRFIAFNTLKIRLEGTSLFIPVDVYLVKTPPVLSMDEAPSSTDSAGWWIKPTEDLENFVAKKTPLGFNLWENGSMTSTATSGATLSYIFSEKPTMETIASIYKMIKIIYKYLDVSNIYILDHRSFLSRPGQPDIIVSVPFDEGSLVSALQSLNYLATIKKDAKVIDLSFRNPIIR